MPTPTTRRTDEHHPSSRGRDHRPLWRHGEEVQQEDARPCAGALGRVLAQPSGTQGHDGAGRQGREVGRLRPQPEVLRPHGGLGADRLQLVPGLRVLRGVQRAPRCGQGARGPTLAGFDCVHAARARRHGLRRGDDRDAADRDGRDGGRAARATGGGGPRRADGVHRHGEHELARQRRARHRVRGIRGIVRPQTARHAGPTLAGMTDATAMGEDPFVTHRRLLFTVAYELLGSAADAEDAVQETWLRWDGIGEARRAEVLAPRAYLVRIVSRLALNRLRTLARRKEEYVGEWLPEPLLTTPDVADDVELAESVSMAMLTVLETLTPTERAVFVLREVFDVPYEEIAMALDKTAAAVRQTAHRAREHVEARRPRVKVDSGEQQRVVERFLAAIASGDVQGLMEVLAPDVVVVADGGGHVAAAPRPIV